jgi:hypothetical protein
MMRPLVALMATLLLQAPLFATAAAPPESAAVPFPVVPLPQPPHPNRLAAWSCMLGGAGLIAASFVIHDRANAKYDEYLLATDPDHISSLYDQTVMLDRFSAASLITGEVLLATGIYLRFLRIPSNPRMSLDLERGACVASWRF